MDAEFILRSIRERWPQAALVAEMTIEDVELVDPPSIDPEHKYTRRIDALMFESLVRTAIEVKVSKADMARESFWKRRPWQRCVHRFVYAVPHDLDVMAPHGCGLWRIHEDGRVEVVKKAILSKVPEPLPQTVVQRLAYRASLPLALEVSDGR